MLEWIKGICTNPFALTALTSWLSAQIIKTVLFLIINRRLDFSRLFGDGGMPSGHSATVTSLALYSALARGPGSFEFAVSFILAVIVCHDATGVRKETEKQGVLIREMAEAFSTLSAKKLPEVKLKEFVGHTPIQVMAGILLGVCNALLMYFVILR